jgi:membrane-associated phospholipid phosphatase
VAPDGSGRPDGMDRHDGGQSPIVLRGAHVLSRRSRVIAALLTGGLVYVIIDIFVQGPLTALDKVVERWDGEASIPSLQHAAWAYDKVGQRSVLVPLLLIVAGALARRHRTWRPAVLAGMSFLILNVVVGAMKIIIGRSETETGDPSVLNGGVIFPSGHSSNMVLTGGLIIYLLVRYTDRPPVRGLIAVVTVLTSITIGVSIYIGSHWVSDLIGGALVGGLLLQAVIVFDRKTARVREDPPAILGPVLRLGLLEADADGVDAVPVPGRRLGSVIEDMPQVRPAPTAADLRSTHSE